MVFVAARPDDSRQSTCASTPRGRATLAVPGRGRLHAPNARAKRDPASHSPRPPPRARGASDRTVALEGRAAAAPISVCRVRADCPIRSTVAGQHPSLHRWLSERLRSSEARAQGTTSFEREPHTARAGRQTNLSARNRLCSSACRRRRVIECFFVSRFRPRTIYARVHPLDARARAGSRPGTAKVERPRGVLGRSMTRVVSGASRSTRRARRCTACHRVPTPAHNGRAPVR